MWLIRRSLGKISGFKRIPIKWRLTWTRRGYKYHTKRPSQSAWQVWPPLPSGQACNEQPWNEACCSVRTRPAGSRALLFWDELTWCISLIAGVRAPSIRPHQGAVTSLQVSPFNHLYYLPCLIIQTNMTSLLSTAFWCGGGNHFHVEEKPLILCSEKKGNISLEINMPPSALPAPWEPPRRAACFMSRVLTSPCSFPV